MNFHHKIVLHDISEIVSSSIAWEELNHKSVLITGINGMMMNYTILLYCIHSSLSSNTNYMLYRTLRH